MPVITDIRLASRASVALEREDLFPIREVARLTGVNPVTLRAWERRYGLVQPARTESGHRLYSMTDIERVRNVVEWIDRGVAVSKIGKILTRTEPLKVQAHPVSDDLVKADYQQWQHQVQRAVSAFDDVELDRIYGQVFSSYALAVVFQDILMPLWRQLLLHQDAFGQTSEWLFFDGFLRARVLQRIMVLSTSLPHKIIVSTLAGQCRELELLVAALFLSGRESGVRVLTTGQPFDELTLVCEKVKPQALVLFSNHAPASDLPQRLNRLARSLDCQLLLAGDTADLAQDNLAGTSIGCIGNEGETLRQRLTQFLVGDLDA